MNSTMTDRNGNVFEIKNNYIRHGNRILDASTITTARVKGHKLLINNYKQNMTLPTLTVSFHKESEAKHSLNVLCDLMDKCDSDYYCGWDTRVETFLPDAFGDTLMVHPQYLKYRGRIICCNNVQTVQIKGRKVLVNSYKNNHELPTMCVYFKTKEETVFALSTIHKILWNLNPAETMVSKEEPEKGNPDLGPRDYHDAPAPTAQPTNRRHFRMYDVVTDVFEKQADPTLLYAVIGLSAMMFFWNLLQRGPSLALHEEL